MELNSHNASNHSSNNSSIQQIHGRSLESVSTSSHIVLHSKYNHRLLSGDTVINFIIILGAIFIPVCFALFYGLRQDSTLYAFGVRQIATISATGMYNPGQVIFTYGIHLEAILVYFLFSSIYTTYEEKFIYLSQHFHFENTVEHFNNRRKEFPLIIKLFHAISCNLFNPACSIDSLRAWNFRLHKLSIIFSLFLSFLGSISESYMDTAHGVCAFGFFGCVLIYIVIFHCKITMAVIVDSQQRPFYTCTTYCKSIHRIVWISLSSISAVALFIAVVIAGTCARTSTTCKRYLADIFPALEFLLVSMFMVYIEGFRKEVRHAQLDHVCSPEETQRILGIDDQNVEQEEGRQIVREISVRRVI